MQIAVTFRHMESHEGVKDYVREKVQKLQKYIENPREAHVVLSAEKFRHIAEITVIGDGVTLNSEGRNSDLYAAIDQMVDKIERQIRERRGKGRRKKSSSVKTGLSPQPADVFESGEEAEIPPVIQRRRTVARPMTLDEAVAQLDLSKEDFFIFINANSGEINVLCRSKEDGGYEWVEPRPK
jgi:putative sigma-54 modulation protein